MTIQPARIRVLNDVPPREGADYVLYLMQQAMRVPFNPALELAIEEANRLRLPLLRLRLPLLHLCLNILGRLHQCCSGRQKAESGTICSYMQHTRPLRFALGCLSAPEKVGVVRS